MLLTLSQRLEVFSASLEAGRLNMSQLPSRSHALLLLALLWGIFSPNGSVSAQPTNQPAVQPPFLLKDLSAESLAAVRQAAEKGDANARFELARRLYLGQGVAQDVMTADTLFQQAALAGHPEAQLKLGIQAERAIGCKLDHDVALAWYQKSAEQGNPVAQYKAGLFYDHGTEPITRKTGPNSTFTGSAVPADRAKAKAWFARGADQGYGPALFRLSNLDYGRMDPSKPPEILPGSEAEKGQRELTQAAEMGVPDAMLAFVGRNSGFLGGPKNLVQAYRWGLLAPNLPEMFGEYSLMGKMERSMTADELAEARRLAAATRFPTAKPEVIRWQELIHHLNPGSPALASATSSNVFQKLTADAGQGNAVAQFNLGLCLLHDAYWEAENFRQGPLGYGMVATEDPAQTRDGKAARLFEQAADQGHRDAQYHLAWMYLNARGFTEDKLKARQRFEQAAKQGHAAAKYQLVLLMEQEVGGPKVMTEITRLLREAADAGHAEAAQRLAILFPATTTTFPSATPVAATTQRSRPRLAVLSLTDGVAATADILVATLSTKQGVELVDRQEIDKVLREQALSALKPGDLNHLGQLLRADGFLLLRTFNQTGKPALDVRLLATGPGVAINQWGYPLPLSDPALWSEAMAKQLMVYLPKLLVLPQNAVPVSILNLRSGISSRQSQEQERQLTFLLIHRLLRSPEVFVLERQSLERLAEEKELTGGGNEAFWNGSYLLDGMINRDGEEPNRVTIHARLISRQQKTNEVFVIGAASELPAVIDQLVGKLAPYLNQTNQAKAWNPAEEAAYYFEEAKWAMRWNMFTEAQQASEASWALGLRPDELRKLRISVYERAAETRMGGRYFLNNKLVKVEFPPDPAKLDPMLRAVDLYLESAPPALSDADKQGVALLDRSVKLLEHFYLVPASWPDAKEKLATLRAKTKELATALFPSASSMPDQARQQYYALLISQGSLWEDNDALAAQALERYLTQEVVGSYLKIENYSEPVFGNWYDWSGSAATTARSAAIEKLATTGPVATQMDACFAGIILAENSTEYNRWLERIADICLAHRDEVIKGDLMDKHWLRANQYLYRVPRSFMISSAGKMPAKIQEMKTIVAARQDYAKAKVLADKAKEVEETYLALKKIMQGSNPLTFGERSKYFWTKYTPEQAQELLALWPDYEKRLGKNAEATATSALKFYLDQRLKANRTGP